MRTEPVNQLSHVDLRAIEPALVEHHEHAIGRDPRPIVVRERERVAGLLVEAHLHARCPSPGWRQLEIGCTVVLLVPSVNSITRRQVFTGRGLASSPLMGSM